MMEDQPGPAAVILEPTNKVLLMKEQFAKLTEQVRLVENANSQLCIASIAISPDTFNISVNHNITPSSDSSHTVVITVVRLGI